MDRIKVKQVEGALDTQSEQVVTGSKVFAAPQHFPSEELIMTIANGYLYWCQNQGRLNELGNTRIRAQEGTLTIEFYDGRSWIAR
jgi:hypothetical protein